MSDIITQETRKAEAIRDAVEAVRGVIPDTERIDTTLIEPMLADENKLAAIVAELAEIAVRQERAFGHMTNHIVADLTKRVEKLEENATKPATKSGSKSKK